MAPFVTGAFVLNTSVDGGDESELLTDVYSVVPPTLEQELPRMFWTDTSDTMSVNARQSPETVKVVFAEGVSWTPVGDTECAFAGKVVTVWYGE